MRTRRRSLREISTATGPASAAASSRLSFSCLRNALRSSATMFNLRDGSCLFTTIVYTVSHRVLAQNFTHGTPDAGATPEPDGQPMRYDDRQAGFCYRSEGRAGDSGVFR